MEPVFFKKYVSLPVSSLEVAVYGLVGTELCRAVERGAEERERGAAVKPYRALGPQGRFDGLQHRLVLVARLSLHFGLDGVEWLAYSYTGDTKKRARP